MSRGSVRRTSSPTKRDMLQYLYYQPYLYKMCQLQLPALWAESQKDQQSIKEGHATSIIKLTCTEGVIHSSLTLWAESQKNQQQSSIEGHDASNELRCFVSKKENSLALSVYTLTHFITGLGTQFFAVWYVTFFSVLKKERSVLFHSFLEFLAIYETQKNFKNATFFCKERNVLLQRTEKNARTFRSFAKECKMFRSFFNIYIEIYIYI